MRIILLNQYYAPDEAATAQLLSDLGSELVRSGCDVDVVTGNRGYEDPSRRHPARERIDGVEIRRVRTTGFGRRSGLGRAIDYATFVVGAVWRLLTMRRPDVIVALTTPPLVGLIGVVVGKLRSSRVILWSMDVYPDVAYELGTIRERSIAGRVVRRLAELTHSMPDTVVALGEAMRQRLLDRMAERVEVIHNWSDGEVIEPRPIAGHPLREEWGWRDEFVLMYSGNMGLAHEFDTVLEAARQGLEGAKLAFVGNGPRREEIVKVALELGAGSAARPTIEIRPYMPRELLPLSLTAPDVHLVTLRESMPGLLVPSKIYGILAAGRPSIYVGPPRGEIYEILREGECGWRVEIGDVAGMLDAVDRYRSDPDRSAEEGSRARELFDQRFAKRIGLGKWVRLVTGSG